MFKYSTVIHCIQFSPGVDHPQGKNYIFATSQLSQWSRFCQAYHYLILPVFG